MLVRMRVPDQSVLHRGWSRSRRPEPVERRDDRVVPRPLLDAVVVWDIEVFVVAFPLPDMFDCPISSTFVHLLGERPLGSGRNDGCR